MYNSSASTFEYGPNRSSWTINYEQLSVLVVALDAATLIGGALISHGVHDLLAYGNDVDATMFASAAAIPIGFLLPALYAEGGYRRDAILQSEFSRAQARCDLGRRLAVPSRRRLRPADQRQFRSWQLRDLRGGGPDLALLLERRLVANLARAAVGTGQLRPLRAFVITDAAGHALRSPGREPRHAPHHFSPFACGRRAVATSTSCLQTSAPRTSRKSIWSRRARALRDCQSSSPSCGRCPFR